MNKKKHILLLAFCVLFFTYQYGLRSAIPNVLNGDLQNYFGANTSQIGFLVSLFYLAYTVMQIPGGIIMDRANAKNISALSFALFSSGLICFVVSPDLICAAVAQLFLGISASFSFILIMKVSNDYFSREKVAIVSGIAVSAGSLGPVICNPLLAHLSGVFPWINVVLFFGLLGIICAVVGFFVIQGKDSSADLSVDSSVDSFEDLNSQVETETSSVFEDVKTIISDRRYIVIGIFSMAVLGSLSSFCDAWGVSFMTCVHGISREQASLAVSFVYTGTIIGGPLFAYLSGVFNSFKKVMLGGAVSFAILLGFVSFVKLPIIMLYAILFVMGISAMCQFLAFPAALSLGEKRLGATVTSIVNTLTMLGCTVLIWAFGCILDWSKRAELSYSIVDYRYGMTASIVSVLLAVLILSFTELPKDQGISE